MKQLYKDQSGVAHLLLIAVFVVALAGLGTVAYTRINASNSEVASLEQETAEDKEQLNDEAVNADQPDEFEKANEEAAKEAAQ